MSVDLGEQPAGGYWLVGTHPLDADQSIKIPFCLGSEEDAAACAPVDDDTGDTGGEIPEEGCGGCSSTGGGAVFLLGLLGILARRPTDRVC